MKKDFTDALWDRLQAGLTLPGASDPQGSEDIPSMMRRFDPETGVGVTLIRSSTRQRYEVILNSGTHIHVEMRGRGPVFVSLVISTFHAMVAAAS